MLRFVRTEGNGRTTSEGDSAPLENKAREARMTWFGQVHIRESNSTGRRTLGMELPQRRPNSMHQI